MKTFLIMIGVVLVLVAGGVGWSKSSQSKNPDIISKNGIHWHPELVIYVNGKKQEIPADIGVQGTSMVPVHTHDDADQGIIHLEFEGLVKESDIMLGEFFKSWDKDMHSFGTNMKMMVNGEESTEYETYVMHDKDKIELYFN